MGDGSSPTTNPVAVEDPAITAQKLLKAEAEAETARAATETAELNRDKAARELAEVESPLSDAKREAEDKKAIDVANQAGAEARQKQIAALLPDLTKLEGGDLKTGEGGTLFGPTLAKSALSSAANELAEACLKALDQPEEWKLLVTSDPELATSDAVYQDVLAGIKQMSSAMEPLFPKDASDSAPKPTPPDGKKPLRPFAALIPDVVTALATIVPSAISLLLPRRTLSSAAISVDSTAATAAAIGALRAKKETATIIDDGFRLLPEGGTVLSRLAELETGRQKLIGHKLAAEGERTEATAAISTSEEKVKELTKAIEKADAKDKPSLEGELRDEKQALVEHRKTVSDASTRIGLIDSAVKSVDDFLTTLRTTSPGSARSPLATALLREQLHRDKDEGLTHVLLIQAEEGAAHQVLDDRRWKADLVSVVGNINVSYKLIDAKTSCALAAGVVSGSATVSGKIGSKLELDQ